jgi:hypothetical protein
MQRLIAILGLVLALFAAVACGGGGGDTANDSPETKQAIRDLLVKLITASQADDLATAKPYLDVASYLHAMDSPKVSRMKDMSEAELADELQSAFNQLKTVQSQSKLGDPVSIKAALAGAKIDVLEQTKTADVEFQGPDSQGAGNVTFRAKLTLHPGRGWLLQTIEVEF